VGHNLGFSEVAFGFEKCFEHPHRAVQVEGAHVTRRGRFAAWAELLDGLELKGEERLLDIGCGRGAVLLMAARRYPALRTGASPNRVRKRRVWE
jgi:hypothetical protein